MKVDYQMDRQTDRRKDEQTMHPEMLVCCHASLVQKTQQVDIYVFELQNHKLNTISTKTE